MNVVTLALFSITVILTIASLIAAIYAFRELLRSNRSIANSLVLVGFAMIVVGIGMTHLLIWAMGLALLIGSLAYSVTAGR